MAVARRCWPRAHLRRVRTRRPPLRRAPRSLRHDLVSEVWSILTPPQRRGILTMQVVSLAMAFSTVTGIAAIAPFFAVLGDPQLIDRNALLHWAYVHGGFSSKRGFVVLSAWRSSRWC